MEAVNNRRRARGGVPQREKKHRLVQRRVVTLLGAPRTKPESVSRQISRSSSATQGAGSTQNNREMCALLVACTSVEGEPTVKLLAGLEREERYPTPYKQQFEKSVACDPTNKSPLG